MSQQSKCNTAPQQPKRYNQGVCRNAVRVIANEFAACFHTVIARPVAHRKPPVRDGWKERPATAAEVAAALDDPDLVVGMIPGRAGQIVIDVDTDRGKPVDKWVDEVEESLGPPLYSEPTPSGGRHLHYLTDRPVGDSVWEGGEVKCLSGYAVTYAPEGLLAALENVQDSAPVDMSAWPISAPQAHTKRTGAAHRRASGPSASREHVLRRALEHIDCRRLGRWRWVTVLMGLHHDACTGRITHDAALQMAVAWSRTDPRRFHEGECERLWRGFRSELPDGREPVTAGTVLEMGVWFGYRPGRKWNKPKHKWGRSRDPDLNGRQERELDHLYAQARQQRTGRKDRLTVRVNHGHLASLMDCSRRTVVRDVAHLQEKKRMREVGREVIRHATGGHVEKVYELLPVGARHQKPVSLIPDGQRAAWQACAAERQEVPSGPRVLMGGRLFVVVPPHVTGGLPRLFPVDSRAPP